MRVSPSNIETKRLLWLAGRRYRCPSTHHARNKTTESSSVSDRRITLSVQNPGRLLEAMQRLRAFVGSLSFLDDGLKQSERFHSVCNIAAETVAHHLDVSNLTQLREGRKDLVVIQNMPFKGSNDTRLAELAVIGLSKLMRTNPFQFRNDSSVRLVRHFEPFTDTVFSTAIDRPLHTEAAHRDDRPDYLALYCLSCNKQTKIRFLHLDTIYELASSQLKSQLEREGRHKVFKFSPSHKYAAHETRVGSLLWTNSGEIDCIRYSEIPGVLASETSEGTSLLNNLREMTNANREFLDATSVDLFSGHLVVWNNHRTLHGESATGGSCDAADRLLLRCNLTENLSLPLIRT